MKKPRFTRLVPTIFAALMTTQAAAEEWRVYTGAWSQHFTNTKGDHLPFQSNHKLAAIQYKSVIGGYFENSFYMDTFFIGGAANWTWKKLDVVGSIGVNYGYHDCLKTMTPDKKGNKEFCAYAIGGAYYNHYVLQPGILISPGFGALSLRWEFNL